MAGLITKEALDELETAFLYFNEKFPTQPMHVNVVSADMLENAGKLLNCLHPDGEPSYNAILVEPAGFVAADHGPFPDGTLTLCVTGNGPTSDDNARLISAVLWLLPELIRTSREGLRLIAEQSERLVTSAV